MKKTLIGISVAAAFALPFTVQAQGSDSGSGPSKDAATMHTPATPGGTSAPNVGAGASTGSSGTVVSGSSTRSGSMDFSAIDSNNDGTISRAEWDAYHARGSSSGATGGALGGGAATPPGAGRGVGDNTQTPGRPNSATGGQPSRP